MSEFIAGARLRFPLPDVLAAAEHAAAATEHQQHAEETDPRPSLWWVKDDGTYLMSNGVDPEGTPDEARAPTVHAEGWGPGTDAGSILGGDDRILTSFPLCEPSATAEGTLTLDVLRASVRAGHTWLVLEIGTDQEQCRMTTETGPSPLITSNTADATGLRVPMNVTVTGEEVYPAMVDVTERWNGWLSPHLTLDTVRQLAADLQADAAKYDHRDTETVHVIEGGKDENGGTEVIVVHIRWMYYPDDGAQCATIVAPDANGLYCIGGWEWTWSAVEPDTDDEPAATTPEESAPE